MKIERQIIFLGNSFQEFYVQTNSNVNEKIGYVFKLIKTVEKVSNKFLKYLEGTDGLYEVRIEVGNNIYRIFCCFDYGNLIVLFNAFQKKTPKTPKQEIDLALKLKKEYFILKNNQNEKKGSNNKR